MTVHITVCKYKQGLVLKVPATNCRSRTQMIVSVHYMQMTGYIPSLRAGVKTKMKMKDFLDTVVVISFLCTCTHYYST